MVPVGNIEERSQVLQRLVEVSPLQSKRQTGRIMSILRTPGGKTSLVSVPVLVWPDGNNIRLHSERDGLQSSRGVRVQLVG